MLRKRKLLYLSLMRLYLRLGACTLVLGESARPYHAASIIRRGMYASMLGELAIQCVKQELCTRKTSTKSKFLPFH